MQFASCFSDPSSFCVDSIRLAVETFASSALLTGDSLCFELLSTILFTTIFCGRSESDFLPRAVSASSCSEGFSGEVGSFSKIFVGRVMSCNRAIWENLEKFKVLIKVCFAALSTDVV